MNGKSYTQNELEFIKNSTEADCVIAEQLGRSLYAIRQARLHYNLPRKHKRVTKEEISQVSELVKQGMTNQEIADVFGRTNAWIVTDIKRKAGVLKYTRYTKNEIEFLKQNFQALGYDGCMKALHRSYNSISIKVMQLGLIYQPDWIISDSNAAYIAGLLDGEGCLSLSVHWTDSIPSIYPNISISNTNQDLMNWLLENIPGYIKKKKSSPHRKPGFSLEISAPYRTSVLRRLMPYLIVKKHLAELTLNILSNSENAIESAIEIYEINLRIRPSPNARKLKDYLSSVKTMNL